jgi:hypothetical protein
VSDGVVRVCISSFFMLLKGVHISFLFVKFRVFKKKWQFKRCNDKSVIRVGLQVRVCFLKSVFLVSLNENVINLVEDGYRFVVDNMNTLPSGHMTFSVLKSSVCEL